MDEWGPEKVVCVSDRRTGMRGVLVIDNTARGMGKGGTRMAPGVTVGQVGRLARVMTWKWAGLDLFFGGAKAGIRCDPAVPDKEAVLRSFARALSNEVPAEYVFGLDVGLTENDAAILADEIGGRAGAVGTPGALGGVAYDEIGVTGLGVAEVTDVAAAVIGLPLAGARVTIQGFGAVGRAAALRLAELGAVVTAVSTASGARHDPEGFDVAQLVKLAAAYGDDCVHHVDSGRFLPAGEELLLPADVLIPAAREDVIDAGVAARLPARLVVEGANLPTSPAAVTVLAERGVTVVPDIVANGGGIVAAAIAMDARHSAFRPDPQLVRDTVATRLRANAEAVLTAAAELAQTPHDAARFLAQERVREAMRLRGQNGW